MADLITDNQNDYADELFVHPVRVVRAANTDDQLMRIARQRANDPTIFDDHSPIFFAIEASNNRMDAYFTRMAKNTLRNFEADARQGVSFQDSHLTRQLGLGATLDARLNEEGELLRLTSDVFTMPGLPDLDAFIHRFRAGIARDVSVGFFGGKHICALCNRSIWSWDCPHIPGVEYEVETRNDQGEVTSKQRQIAFAWIDGARLSEISAVYDGATPGCAILKAQREADSGRMTPDVANLLENRYRGLRLNAAHRRWAGADFADLGRLTAAFDKLQNLPTAGEVVAKGVRTMADQINTEVTQPGVEPGAEARSASAAAQPAAEANEFERLVQSLAEAAGLPAEVSSDFREVSTHLRQMVADGKAYRERVVDEALTAGVRLFGNEFDKEGTRALFSRADVESIRKMTDQWSRSADKLFPAGRQSDDHEQPEPPVKRTATVPDSVFGG